MKEILGILIIAAVAGLIVLLSEVRKKRIQPYLDAFVRAFCDASDHLLGEVDSHGVIQTEPIGSGAQRLLPAEQQPSAVRALLERGIDDYVHQKIREMFDLRAKAQAHLTGFNLIGKRINGVLNRVYDLANISFSIVNNPATPLSADDVKDFDFFLNKQAYLRNTTLAAIASSECKAAIAR